MKSFKVILLLVITMMMTTTICFFATPMADFHALNKLSNAIAGLALTGFRFAFY